MIFDRLTIFYEYFDHGAGDIAFNFIHELHRFDDAERFTDGHRISDLYIRWGIRRG